MLTGGLCFPSFFLVKVKGTGEKKKKPRLCDPKGHLENEHLLAQPSRVQNTQKGGCKRQGTNSSQEMSHLEQKPHLSPRRRRLVQRVKIQTLSPAPSPSRKRLSPAWNCRPQHLLSLSFSPDPPASILSLFLSFSFFPKGRHQAVPTLVVSPVP